VSSPNGRSNVEKIESAYLNQFQPMSTNETESTLGPDSCQLTLWNSVSLWSLQWCDCFHNWIHKLKVQLTHRYGSVTAVCGRCGMGIAARLAQKLL